MGAIDQGVVKFCVPPATMPPPPCNYSLSLCCRGVIDMKRIKPRCTASEKRIIVTKLVALCWTQLQTKMEDWLQAFSTPCQNPQPNKTFATNVHGYVCEEEGQLRTIVFLWM